MTSVYAQAYVGALAADAVAMPVHWYYDTQALDADYGQLEGYVAPKSPHCDSILWRSRYIPRNAKGNILHEQARFWGQRGIHYHQFLKAGENTINYKLGKELYQLVTDQGRYDASAWLERYINRMLEPDWHEDTYLEEYHRAFFNHYASGKAPFDCGIDDLHIGGISQVPALLAALDQIGVGSVEEQVDTVVTHVQLTHRNRFVVESAETLTRMLAAVNTGSTLRDAIKVFGSSWASSGQLDTWSSLPDRSVVGRHLTMACYLPESFTASLFLCWRYADDFTAGILANAHCGGDNCHRGAVVGALLGAANSVPDRWREGLLR